MRSELRIGAIALGATITLAGCGERATAPQNQTDPAIRTIKQTNDMPALPLPADTAALDPSASAVPLVDLPFTPAISMDPVDGGKVSIHLDTPVVEFKDRLYYFRTEENRQAFLRNPDKYAAGSLSRY